MIFDGIKKFNIGLRSDETVLEDYWLDRANPEKIQHDAYHTLVKEWSVEYPNAGADPGSQVRGGAHLK